MNFDTLTEPGTEQLGKSLIKSGSFFEIPLLIFGKLHMHTAGLEPTCDPIIMGGGSVNWIIEHWPKSKFNYYT